MACRRLGRLDPRDDGLSLRPLQAAARSRHAAQLLHSYPIGIERLRASCGDDVVYDFYVAARDLDFRRRTTRSSKWARPCAGCSASCGPSLAVLAVPPYRE